jgi:hypothetical protein
MYLDIIIVYIHQFIINLKIKLTLIYKTACSNYNFINLASEYEYTLLTLRLCLIRKISLTLSWCTSHKYFYKKYKFSKSLSPINNFLSMSPINIIIRTHVDNLFNVVTFLLAIWIVRSICKIVDLFVVGFFQLNF